MNNKLATLIILGAISAIYAVPSNAYDKFRDLYPQKAKYIKRSYSAWSKMGRIVGVLKHPPDELTIVFFSIATGKTVQVYKAPGQLNIYMSRLLAPGTYRVTIKSPGFHGQTVKRVKVKAHTDCMLNIVFGLRVYVND
ncbi:MAG: carboxypeptidase regulatory-like domain-containing protein [Kiritimatiellaeota bacterium]|nr:carboxypeptidase regulatory-like domain-containing protein [Kiritimatiellota bacterium]